jgi:hypothetical protein
MQNSITAAKYHFFYEHTGIEVPKQETLPKIYQRISVMGEESS